MATRTLLTIADYAALDEPAGVRYELSEGELIVSPSPNYLHNRIRDRFNVRLLPFVEARGLGSVISEMDFQLSEDTVRRPDVAFIRRRATGRYRSRARAVAARAGPRDRDCVTRRSRCRPVVEGGAVSGRRH